MMQLIQQLAACKSYDFSGWFLAEASLCWKERPIRFHWRSAERRSGGPCCKCWDGMKAAGAVSR